MAVGSRLKILEERDRVNGLRNTVSQTRKEWYEKMEVNMEFRHGECHKERVSGRIMCTLVGKGWAGR